MLHSPLQEVICEHSSPTQSKQVIKCFLGTAKRGFWSISADCGLCHGQYVLTLIISRCSGQSGTANILSPPPSNIAHLRSWEPFIYL